MKIKMAKHLIALTFSLLVCLTHAQRSPFAGSRPIGYPELADRFKNPNEIPAIENVFDGSLVDNRFGEDNYYQQKLPVDALGDRYLLEMISRWPVEKQPYWFINYQAIEKFRGGSPPAAYVPLPTQQQPVSGFMSG